LAPQWILLVMLGVFGVLAMAIRMPIGLALALSAVAGSLAGGAGVPIDQLVEGGFAYIDPILIIAAAMLFMGVLEESGALGSISRSIVIRLHRRTLLLVVGITFFIMFPGMITGQSTATVLTSGAIAAPALIACGVPPVKVAAMVAMTAIYGMIAPPISLPTMIIGSGVDMPFVGFELPLLVATLPLAVGVNLWLARPYLRDLHLEQVPEELGPDHHAVYGLRLYIPLVVVVLLLAGIRLFPAWFPNLGIALVLVIGSVVGAFTGRRFSVLETAQTSLHRALPVMGILVGVGMFIQIMTLTGVRGLLVVSALELPSVLKYAGVSVMMPVFGAVSAYGSASVLGVPFLLSFLGQNEIIVGAALSLFAGLGDLMPPTALAGIFAAQLVGESNYLRVLKHTAVPALATVLWALAMILLADPLASVLLL
jgi:TRAP-type C4-dicarboxylate transport system permease large subunit